MKPCSYTNFGTPYSTVDVDFRFSAHIKIFEIAKFFYCYINSMSLDARSVKVFLTKF